MNLDWLARKHGTDKGSCCHGYTEFYEQMFGSIRKRIHSVLELGIDRGASLKMWADWFPNATIYAVDNCHQPELPEPIIIFRIEQTNEGLLRETFRDKFLQIIIDDCSHDQEKTIQSLCILFPMLEDNGWYVIEDMEPSSFPKLFSEWLQNHYEEYKSVHTFRDKQGSSHIYFIHKG